MLSKFLKFCLKLIFLLFLLIPSFILLRKLYRKKLRFIQSPIARYYTKNYDISKMPSKDCTKNFKGNIWLISYASGHDVHHQNQRLVSATGMLNCVNRIILYKKDDIESKFYEKNKKILDSKRGGGYWLWKPYFIYKSLLQIPEGDYLIYLDSGVKMLKPATQMIEDFLIGKNKEMVFQYQEHTRDSSLVAHTKRNVLKFFNIDKEEFFEYPIMYNCFTIIKNTKNTREFYRKLLEYSSNAELIMDKPYGKDEYPNFLYHRHDGSILTAFYLANKKEFDKFILIESSKVLSGNYLSYFHRRDNNKTVNLVNKDPYVDKETFAFEKVKKNF